MTGTLKAPLRVEFDYTRSLGPVLSAFMTGLRDRTVLGGRTLRREARTMARHLDADPEKVVEKASFIDDLGADSLDIVELVMAFEEEFGVEIPDDAAEKIGTVKDAIDYLDQNKG